MTPRQEAIKNLITYAKELMMEEPIDEEATDMTSIVDEESEMTDEDSYLEEEAESMEGEETPSNIPQRKLGKDQLAIMLAIGKGMGSPNKGRAMQLDLPVPPPRMKKGRK